MYSSFASKGPLFYNFFILCTHFIVDSGFLLGAAFRSMDKLWKSKIIGRATKVQIGLFDSNVKAVLAYFVRLSPGLEQVCRFLSTNAYGGL